jgi:cytochrome P450
MTFGWGQHFCIGFGIALTQIPQTLKPLLARGQLRRAAGRPGRTGFFCNLFYENLRVTYRSDGA